MVARWLVSSWGRMIRDRVVIQIRDGKRESNGGEMALAS